MNRTVKSLLIAYFMITLIFLAVFLYFRLPFFRYQLNEEERISIGNSDYIIAVQENNAPFSFLDETGLLQGYEIDLLQSLEDEFGFSFEYRLMDWSDALSALESDEIHGISGISLGEHLEDRVLYSHPYFTVTQSLVSSRPIEISSTSGMSDFNLIFQNQIAREAFASNNTVNDVILVEDFHHGIETLLAQDEYYLMENSIVASYYLRDLGLESSYYIHPLNNTRKSYGIAISRSEPLLAKTLSKIIRSLEAEGRFEELDHKWFGMNVERNYLTASRIQFLLVIGFIAFSLLFILYLRAKLLAVQLQKRTSDLQDLNKQLEKEEHKMKQFVSEVANTFAAAIDYRDPYTGNHNRRVARISLLLAKKLGMPKQQQFETYIGALLHDMGKVGIPDEILRKPGPLLDKEYIRMKKHPEIGKEILENINSYDTIKDIVFYRHERWDGNIYHKFSSYPGLLCGEEIPYPARIVAVADTFDAITSSRPYRKAESIEFAIKTIKECSGNQLDPKVVDAMSELSISSYSLIENIVKDI